MNQAIEPIEPLPDHWHEFEPDECDPYHEHCTCGAVRDVGGEYA